MRRDYQFSALIASPARIGLGQSRRFRLVRGMSGLPLIATAERTCRHRRSGPRADSCTATKASLENLVGTAGQRQRNGDAERTGGLQVDEHLDFGRLLHRQIGRLATLKNSPGIDSDETMCFRNVGPVAHQASGRSELAPLVDRGNRVLNRQGGEPLGMAGEERVAPNYQPASSQLSQLIRSKSCSVLAFRTCRSMPRA